MKKLLPLLLLIPMTGCEVARAIVVPRTMVTSESTHATNAQIEGAALIDQLWNAPVNALRQVLPTPTSSYSNGSGTVTQTNIAAPGGQTLTNTTLDVNKTTVENF